MRLSWNEIRARAATFARDWADARYERGDTQTFYNEFFEVFGVQRRKVASFEEPVKKLGDKQGFIDLFWKGKLLVEQKSAGRDLARARQQALDYFPGLKDYELPRYVLVCDFQTFHLIDLDTRDETRFALADLPRHVEAFGFVVGIEKRIFKDQDPVNIIAAELMGKLHDALKASGYDGHPLERLLVRLLFCLFADDTGIFDELGMLQTFIEDRTDSSNLGPKLTHLFQVLNTPVEKRQKNLDEDLARFPYINGDLFAETLPIPDFDEAMRERLLEACGFSWERISPAIFGALFQSVMNAKERRQKGAHYTTEKNILKVIEPLFLDDLRAELARIKDLKRGREAALRAFQDKLASLKLFDPACGCGNFLIIAYRELRLLEIEVLVELYRDVFNRPGFTKADFRFNVASLTKVDVDQFYGIEIDEFPARIAETAMWMMDHIMNNRLSQEFGEAFARIPLKAAPHIMHGDALEIDWATVLPPAECSYVLGNPPFIGHQWRTAEQAVAMGRVWGSHGRFGRLDFVTCWFKKAADYGMQSRKLKIALVSTNSICQGEQASILWPALLRSDLTIIFAHRTFPWGSDARGTAAVHCVIVGMGWDYEGPRTLFDYQSPADEPTAAKVEHINGYLLAAPDLALGSRTTSPRGMPPMLKGSQPTDGARLKQPDGTYTTTSNLILDESDRANLLAEDPTAERWLRPYVGGDELISGQWRWCLWLKDADPADLRMSAPIRVRLDRVRRGRLASPTASVREYAEMPTLFTQDRQPDVAYLAIPEVSSENRPYLPMAFLPETVIASNKLQMIVGADKFLFAILTSQMHMAWVRCVAGRLKSDISYSPSIYNAFPWPTLTDAAKSHLETLAQAILDARAAHPNATLADLYDPDVMPADLRKAHKALDLAVDRLYRKAPFSSDRERVEHLFMLYEKMTAGLLATPAKPKRRKKVDA
ncbi:DNA methyltransferase [uncultured Caulobacter sp.]|uniref:class I SAM-dependent DNA methyltransferase n=1 Tax=uncultured Caulobacter sp. TaxID=158749 RepID=UPI002630D106|nr:DNA methyltransferase [uncultured Caulobacter sp.]